MTGPPHMSSRSTASGHVAPTVCDECAAEGVTCREWCAVNGHKPLSRIVAETCHCGEWGWVWGRRG